MRYVSGALNGVGFLVVSYLFAFGAATQYAAPYQETFVGWAAYKGQTLLLKPGIEYVLRTKGEQYILDAPAGVVTATELGVSLVPVAVVGLAAGVVWSAIMPVRRATRGEGRHDGMALPAVALVLALVAGLGGVVPGYAAFLLGTWALRTGGGRGERIAARFGQLIGALAVAVWAVGLAMPFRSSPTA